MTVPVNVDRNLCAFRLASRASRPGACGFHPWPVTFVTGGGPA